MHRTFHPPHGMSFRDCTRYAWPCTFVFHRDCRPPLLFSDDLLLERTHPHPMHLCFPLGLWTPLCCQTIPPNSQCELPMHHKLRKTKIEAFLITQTLFGPEPDPNLGPGPGSLFCLDRTSRSGPGSALRPPNLNQTRHWPVYV